MKITTLVIVGLLVAPLALADADSERESLARLAHEIDALAPMVDEAQAQADPNARIRFHYDWLRADLARVRRGIVAHINAPHTQPRSVPPLIGDYRHR